METPENEDTSRRQLVVRQNTLPAPTDEWRRRQLRRLYRYTRHIDQVAARINRHVGVGKEEIASGPIRVGMLAIVVVFGVFGLWAAFAPLYSAAIAHGVVVLTQSVKSIQHLEGGIVEAILVKEGETVVAGQPLVKLDLAAARARRDLLRGQYYAAKAAEARLLAERDNAPAVVFDPKVQEMAAIDPGVRQIVDAQQRLFESRRTAISGQIDILQQKIAQSSEEINGMRAQEEGAQRQIELLNEEIANVKTLLASRNASRPRLLALQRQAADIQGNKGQYQAGIARAKQTINESELEMVDLKNKFLNEVMTDLRERQEAIASLEEQVRAAEDVVTRSVIQAPDSGVVKGLAIHTRGGVVQPGQKIMDIVPQNDELIIEAQVLPQDIDVVHAGLQARVHLVAFKTRRVPPVNGEVLSVSADSFREERTNQTYYVARVKVDMAMLNRLKDVKLYPGMPADVQIVTGERTMLSYFVTPITDAFFRAFREQ